MERSRTDRWCDWAITGLLCAIAIAKHTQPTDGKFTCRHVNIFQFNVPCLYWFFQFHIIVRHIFSVPAFINEQVPFFSIK